MDGSQARQVTLLDAPSIPLAAPAPRLLSGQAALLFGVGWPALVAFLLAIEPEPAMDMVPPAWVQLLGTGFFIAVLGTMLAAAARSPMAARWSLGAGAALLALAVGCPASGHHSLTAAWWLVQLGAGGGMIAASARSALRH